MAEEAKEAAKEEAASDSGDGGGKLVSVLSIFNLLISIGMAAVLFITFKKERTIPAVEDISVQEEEHASGKEAGEHGGGGHGSADKHGGKAESKSRKDFGKMITLEQFTVNLSTPGSSTPKFIRVNIAIEVPNEDTEAELTLKMPQVRNVIIDLFNSKRPNDIANSEGRDYLKEEIKNALNGFMITGKVRGVFFTGFAVSS